MIGGNLCKKAGFCDEKKHGKVDLYVSFLNWMQLTKELQKQMMRSNQVQQL